MRDYFIRRFLLLIPTLMVITVIVFCVTRIAPGGPLERAMMEMRQAQMEGGGGGGATATGKAISKKDLEQMQELYGYDKPGWQAYLIWLGVMSRERHKEEFVFKDGGLAVTGTKRIPTFPVMELDWNGDSFVARNEVPRTMRNEVRFELLDT